MTSHLHLDHLGTPRQITRGGQQVALHSYYPFGQEATSAGADEIQLKFTGHERDKTGTGARSELDYMHARYCSPVLGRFLSVDPVAKGEESRPQSWNLFSYAGNSPTNRLDPDGRKDRRTSQEVVLTEDADVQIAILEILRQTLLDRPVLQRQEAGVVVTEDGPNDFGLDTGGVKTDGNLTQITFRLRKKADGAIVGLNNNRVAATIHSHVGTARVVIDGQRKTLAGGIPSPADRSQAKAIGVPVLILNGERSIIKVESVGNSTRSTVILSGRDMRSYLQRARAAAAPPTGDLND